MMVELLRMASAFVKGLRFHLLVMAIDRSRQHQQMKHKYSYAIWSLTPVMLSLTVLNAGGGGAAVTLI